MLYFVDFLVAIYGQDLKKIGKKLYVIFATQIFWNRWKNGAKYSSADKLANKIDELWKKNLKEKFVVFTGGEPLLQLNKELIDICIIKILKLLSKPMEQ